VTEVEARINLVRSTAEEANRRAAAATSASQAVAEQLAQAERVLANEREQRVTAEAKLNLARGELLQLRADAERMRTQQKAMEAERLELTQRLTSLESDLAAERTQSVSLKTTLEETMEEITSRFDAGCAEFASARRDRETMEANVMELTTALATASAAAARAQGERDLAVTELNEGKAMAVEAATSAADARERMRDAENRANAAQLRVTSLEEESVEIRRVVAEEETRRRVAEESVEATKTALDHAARAAEATIREMDKEREEKERLGREKRELEAKLVVQDQASGGLHSLVKQLEEQLASLNERLTESLVKSETETQRRVDTETELEQLKQTHSALDLSLGIEVERREAAEHRLALELTRLEDLKAQLGGLATLTLSDSTNQHNQ